VAASLQDHAEEEWCQGHLRKMIEKSPHKAVRAAAQFSLGCGLMAGEKATEAQKAEGKKLLEGVRKDYADTEFAKRAEGQLFEIEHLQVGKLAPDVEATDQDGKKFRLSEYRGKVVVLDFWGFW
jgi:cytochrome oxidase Cu insertion factor (SCO1/SenC/PrrC family)